MIERFDPNSPKLRQKHIEKIADYYNRSNLFYFVMWHRRAFGLHYGLWLEGVKNRIEAITKENEFLADLAGIRAGDIVLDAGCGVGGSAAWIAKNRGAKVIGINLSDVQLGGAKRVVSERKFGYQVQTKTGFAKADYHRLPFKDGAFNVVWSLESLEHAVSVEEFVRESARVLKPGGRLVIAATLAGTKQPTDEELRQLQVGIETSGAFKESKTGDEVRKLMESAGLSNVGLSNFTEEVLPSAHEITSMCKAWYGKPGFVRFLSKIMPKFVPSVLAMNNEWGLYQQDLFESGVTAYNVLIGTKSPKTSI